MKEMKPMDIGGGLDPKVRQRLMCINRECVDMVYSRLRRTVMKDVTDYSTLNLAKELIMSKSTPAVARQKLMAMAKSGMLNPQQMNELDATVERELSLCMSQKIQSDIRKGLLPPPPKDEMQEKMNRRIPKK